MWNGAKRLMDLLKYGIIPILLPLILPIVCSYLLIIGRSNVQNGELNFKQLLLGNTFAWKFAIAVVTWASLWFLIPKEEFKDPETREGSFEVTPSTVYKTHGQLYYFASLFVTMVIFQWEHDIPKQIYENMDAIFGVLNLLGLSLSIYVYFHAKSKPKEEDPTGMATTGKFTFALEFFCGVELHPRILPGNADLKQLIILRIGTIMLQVLLIAFLLHSCNIHGIIDPGLFCSTCLQSYFIYKVFQVESRFSYLLEAIYDLTGYYLIWGSFAWMPVIYPYNSYYFVEHPTKACWSFCLFLLVIGIMFVHARGDVSSQKIAFRNNMRKGKSTLIWGKPAECLTLKKGDCQSHLLISGWWGIARKIGYLFQLVISLLQCLFGYKLGVTPFVYFAFITILLFHRIFRDEEKCKKKYGKVWDVYCTKVPYRLVPYLF